VPIDLPQFTLKNGPPRQPPVILAVASFDEPRKGLRVLVRAFEILKRSVPEAVLRLSGSMSPEVRREVIKPLPAAVRADIQVLGIGTLVDLPQHYRRASLTVLPSMWEAYGMTVVESWASGTPVVVTDHAGLRELVDDPALGRLFDPQTDGQETLNAEGLAGAILAALPLAQDEQTRHRCRARAERYSWQTLGPEYEQLYAGP
jgi:glycosyltransferase involved in cell wall biosynthesis